MDGHPTDDELVAYACGDGTPGDTARTSGHLRTCPSCRTELDTMQAALRMARDARVPEPGPGFEAAIWRRIQAALPPAQPRRTVGRLAPLTAWAALVVGGVALGMFWAETDGIPGAPAVTSAPAGGTSADPAGASSVKERVLLTALDQHFGQTEMLLVELLNAPPAAPSEQAADPIAYERAVAGDLIASGRLFRETAEQTGQRQYADVLDELESVLVEVARSPDEVAAADVRAWRAHIEDRALLFKVRAAAHEVRERQDGPATVDKGAS